MTKEQIDIIKEALMMYSQHCVRMSLTNRFKKGLPANPTAHQRKLYATTVRNIKARQLKWTRKYRAVDKTLTDFFNEQHKLISE